MVIVGIRNMSQIVDYLDVECVLYVNRIFDIVGKTTDRYNGLVSSGRDYKYVLIWRIDHQRKRIVTKLADVRLHEEQALYAMVTVIFLKTKNRFSSR
jgi:hypothetical protein